jgi:circadian clock protein KaiB
MGPDLAQIIKLRTDMPEDKSTQDGHFSHDDGGELAAALERAAAGASDAKYVLTLCVAGMRPRSQRSIENIRRLCEEHLAGRYELQIIDIYQQSGLAKDAQIVAAPTLVKKLPPPLRQIIGDLSDDGRVLVAMGIKMPENPGRPDSPSPRD